MAALKASLDSIDQGAMGFAASAAKLDGSRLSIEWKTLQGSYEGTVNAEGSQIDGTWTQRGNSIPLQFNRKKFEMKEVKAIPLAANERDFLISHLEKSRQEFLRSIEGLSKEQWTHKPAGGGWSIADCAEHLTVTEDAIFNMVTQQFLKAPIREGVVRKAQADDEKVIARMLDRSQKAKAPEMLHPTGKWPTADAIKTAFNERRNRSITFVRSTQEDMRGRVAGSMDTYQYFVMMSGHTLRHTAQLNEVKQDAGYPK